METEFGKLIGQTCSFYGVDGNTFKLGRQVFEAVEDPDDGYRSMLNEVKKIKLSGQIFFSRSIATVKVFEVTQRNRPDLEFEGYELVDVADGHLWLRLGTSYSDSYYPCFTFDYRPKRR